MNPIISINSCTALLPYIETSRPDDLFIFDVDDVLIYPADSSLREGSTHKIGPYLEKMALSQKETENYLSIAYSQSQMVLVEEGIYSIFNLLKEKKIQHIGLTSFRPGSYGIVKDTVACRIQELANLRIGFSYDKLQSLPRELHADPFIDVKPVFAEGILFNAPYSKGVVLKEFLNSLQLNSNWFPSRIIFIDDLRKNLESVRDHLDTKIEYHGFEYCCPQIPHPLEEKIAEKQLEILLKHQQWVSQDKIELRGNHV